MQRIGSPFSGMDPYLEQPAYWSGFHNLFINTLGDHLRERLLPAYLVQVEVEVRVVDPHLLEPDADWMRPDLHIARRKPSATAIPDAGTTVQAEMVPQLLEAEITEKHISIVDRDSRRVVTIIELLSPSNKRHWQPYEQKRRAAFQARTGWVEIDLLRRGERRIELRGRSDYYVMTHWGEPLADFKVWFVGLRDPLPTIDIPLHDDGSGIAVDLQAILAQTYQRGGLGYVVRYDDPAVLGLTPADTHWARACVAQWQATQTGSST